MDDEGLVLTQVLLRIVPLLQRCELLAPARVGARLEAANAERLRFTELASVAGPASVPGRLQRART